MNYPRKVANGFTAHEVHKITGLSIHMVDYLAREGYLQPTYDEDERRGRTRGKVRYYSYRDLLVARIVQRLRQRGLELKRLKAAIARLSEDRTWFPKNKRSFDLLTTDGKNLYYHDRTESITEVTAKGQRAFAFVLDVMHTQVDIKGRITRVAPKKLDAYAIENRPLIYLDNRAARS